MKARRLKLSFAALTITTIAALVGTNAIAPPSRAAASRGVDKHGVSQQRFDAAPHFVRLDADARPVDHAHYAGNQTVGKARSVWPGVSARNAGIGVARPSAPILQARTVRRDGHSIVQRVPSDSAGLWGLSGRVVVQRKLPITMPATVPGRGRASFVLAGESSGRGLMSIRGLLVVAARHGDGSVSRMVVDERQACGPGAGVHAGQVATRAPIEISSVLATGSNDVTVSLLGSQRSTSAEGVGSCGPTVSASPLYVAQAVTDVPLPATWGVGSDPVVPQTTRIRTGGVNTATGNVTRQETDAKLNGPGIQLALTRTYNSQSYHMAGDQHVDALGPGWMFGFESRLVRGDATAGTYYVGSDGVVAHFANPASGSSWFTPDPGVRASLQVVSGAIGGIGSNHYVLTEPDKTVATFDDLGRLRQRADSSGLGLQVLYTTATSGPTVYEPSGVVGGSYQLSNSTDKQAYFQWDQFGHLLGAYIGAGHQKLGFAYYDNNAGLKSVMYGETGTPHSSYTYQVNPNGVQQNLTSAARAITAVPATTRTIADRWTYDSTGIVSTYVAPDPKGDTSNPSTSADLTTTFIFVTSGANAPQTTTTGPLSDDQTGGPNQGRAVWVDQYNGNRIAHEQLPYPRDAIDYTWDLQSDLTLATRTKGSVSSSYDTAGTSAQWPMPHLLSTTSTSAGGGVSGSATSAKQSWTYYANSNDISSATDVNGAATNYTYDTLHRVTGMGLPNGSVEQFSYAPDSTKSGEVQTDIGQVTKDTFTDPAPIPAIPATGSASTTPPTASCPTTALGDHTSAAAGASAITSELSKAQQASGNKVAAKKFGFDQYGNLARTTTPEGLTTTYQSDPYGRTASVTAPPRTIVTAPPLKSATETRVAAAFSRSQEHVHAAEGSQAYSARNADRVSVPTVAASLQADAQGVTAIKYHDDDSLLSTTYPDGTVTTVTVDTASGRVTDIKTTPSDKDTTPLKDESFTYDPVGNERTVHIGSPVNTNGSSTMSYTWDAEGRVRSATDGNGGTTSYTYFPDGSVAAVTSPEGNYLAEHTDPAKDPNLYVLRYTYDGDGNQSSVYRQNKLAARTEATDSTYDGLDHLATTKQLETVAAGTAPAIIDTYTYVNDAQGRPRQIGNPNGHANHADYDRCGRWTGVNLSSQAGWTMTGLDGHGRQAELVERPGAAGASGSKTTWSYNGDGQLVTVVDPRGNEAGADPTKFDTVYTYDGDGHVSSLTDEAGSKTSYAYDARGNLSQVTSPRGFKTIMRHDGAGQLVYQQQPLIAAAETNGATSATTLYSHSSAGALNSEAVVTNVGDAMLPASYAYNSAGQLSSVTSLPDGSQHSIGYTYDADGNLSGQSNPDGTSVARDYDAADRLASMVQNTASVGLTSDNAAYTYNAAGWLATAATSGNIDFNPTDAFSYSHTGKLSKVTESPKPGSPAVQTFAYGYNYYDALSSETTADGVTTSYTRDGAGRVAAMSADGLQTSYGYDADNNIATITYPAASKLVQTRTYNPTGRVYNITTKRDGVTDTSDTYARDPDGRPLTIQRTRGNSGSGSSNVTTGYYYDPQGRLIADCPNGVAYCTGKTNPRVSFKYDNHGNLTDETRVGVGGDSTKNQQTPTDAPHLTWKMDSPSQEYSVDNSGQVKGRNANPNEYPGLRAWDALGQETTIYGLDNEAAVTQYDALGNSRVTQLDVGGNDVNTRWTQYWDPMAPAESDTTGGSGPFDSTRLTNVTQVSRCGSCSGPATGGIAYRYGANGDAQWAQFSGKPDAYGDAWPYTSSFLISDAQHSVVDETNASGIMANRNAYEPYGYESTVQNISTAVDSGKGFEGLDKSHNNGGEYHAGGRYFRPNSSGDQYEDSGGPPGTFMSSDPSSTVRGPGSGIAGQSWVNGYAPPTSIMTDPMPSSDPLGLMAGTVPLAGVGATQPDMSSTAAANVNASYGAQVGQAQQEHLSLGSKVRGIIGDQVLALLALALVTVFLPPVGVPADAAVLGGAGAEVGAASTGGAAVGAVASTGVVVDVAAEAAVAGAESVERVALESEAAASAATDAGDLAPSADLRDPVQADQVATDTGRSIDPDTATPAAEDVPSVIFSRSRAPGIAKTFDRSVENGAPTRLNRVTGAARDANRRAALRGEPPAPAGQSLDEYPFACSAQGGCGSFVNSVPASEQSYQGGVLSSFFQRLGIGPGDPFDVMFGP